MRNRVAKKAFTLFFPQELIKEPVMYLVARDHDLILNIRRAKITADYGEATIELEGEEERIGDAVRVMEGKGVKVEPISGDIVQ